MDERTALAAIAAAQAEAAAYEDPRARRAEAMIVVARQCLVRGSTDLAVAAAGWATEEPQR